MPSALVHWDRLLARLTPSVVPVTRKLFAGVGIVLDPLDGQLDDDVSIAVKPHSDGSIGVGSAGVQVGVLASDAQHGTRGGGTIHALAVASGAAGFMSGADKAKLDGVTAGAAGLTSSAPTTIQPDAAAAVGTAVTAARADHVHAIVAAAPGTIEPDDSASEGSSTSFARADHRHAIVAATAGAIQIGDSAAEGSATSFARSDHVHSLAAPSTPASVSLANATGSATSAARSDHVHSNALESYTVGSLPSAATYARTLIYVSDEAGGAVPAFSDGTNWRRVTDRAVVS